MADEKNVLKFENLLYEVKNKDKNIHTKYATIINGLSGQVESGKITAVMGASGCGKTHLFELLIGNLAKNCKTSGTITYNGQERDWKNWTRKIAFLPQDDVYYPSLTLYESIMYNLSFNNLSKKENIEMAIQAMKSACIFHKKDAIIKTLSDGERKCAMIAVTLAENPEILILDEPTTGLDSNSALKIVESLKKYAEEYNKIVIMTVHKPDEGLYNLFGDLIFLTKGGLFYSGEASAISSFLQQHGLECPETMSNSEFLFVLHSKEEESELARRYKHVIDDIVYQNAIKKNLLEAKACNNHKMFFFDLNLRHSMILFKHNLKLALTGSKKKGFIISTICFCLAFYFISFLESIDEDVELFYITKLKKSNMVFSFAEKYALAYKLYSTYFFLKVLIFSIFFSFNMQESTILNLEIFTRKFSIMSHTFYNFFQNFSFAFFFLTLDFCFYMFMNVSSAIPFNIMGLLYLITISSLFFTVITNTLISSFQLGKKITAFLLLLLGLIIHTPSLSLFIYLKNSIESISKYLTFGLNLLFLFPNFNFDLFSSIFFINQIVNHRNFDIISFFSKMFSEPDEDLLGQSFDDDINYTRFLLKFTFLNDYTWLIFMIPLSAAICLILSLIIIYFFRVPNIRLKLMN